MTDHEAAAGIAASAFESLGRGFVDAFNGRDVQALVAVSHEQIALRPSTLVGSRRTYRGHDGLRQWIADLDTANVEFKVRAREIRPLGADSFLVLSVVWQDDQPIAESAMIAVTLDDKIVEAHSYLSDEQTLVALGLIPDAPPAAL